MDQSLQDFIQATLRAQNDDELFAELYAYLGRFGFDTVCYVVRMRNLESVPLVEGTVFNNASEEWKDQYLAQRFGEVDPIMKGTLKSPVPLQWSQVGDRMRLTEEQQKFLDVLKLDYSSDGLSVPVFSGIGDASYFGMSIHDGMLELPPNAASRIALACHQVHNRHLELGAQANEAEEVKLSVREAEVLTLIAAGKSKPDISQRLSIAESTVETLLKRCYEKLGTTNRMAAVLKGIGAGLILP